MKIFGEICARKNRGGADSNSDLDEFMFHADKQDIFLHHKAMAEKWTSLEFKSYNTTSFKSEDFKDWLMVFFFYSFHELLGAQAGATRDSLLL